MASISRRKFKSKISFRVCIKRQGIKRIYKSFNTRTEAKRWARNMEVKLDKGDYSDFTEAGKLTLGDVAKRYIDVGYHLKKKGAIRRVSLWSAIRRFNKRGELVEIVIKTFGRI